MKQDFWNLWAWAAEAAWLRWKQCRRKNPAPAAPQRILVLGYAAVGDSVFFLPVLEALRRTYPCARITFLANAQSNEVTLGLIPATGLVDDIELVEWWEGQSREQRQDAAERIRRGNYDLVLMTLATPLHFFQEAVAAIPCRIGQCMPLTPPAKYSRLAGLFWSLRRALITGEWSRRLLLNRRAWIDPGGEHSVMRNLKLLAAAGLEIPSAAPRPRIPLAEAARRKAEAALPARPGRKWVGIHLGVADNPYFKIWSPERFGRLCRRLKDSGPLDCVLVGGPEETVSVFEARRAAGWEVPSWAGRCSLLESFAMISRCDLFVSCDTGLAKAAMALGVPTVTLWGPTSPGEFGIIWDEAKHLDLRTGISCSPCARAGMAYPRADIHFRNCGHHNCLALMDEGWVFDAIRRKYPQLFG